MSTFASASILRTLFAILTLGTVATAAGAAEWQVVKSSGEVWVAGPKAQAVSLSAQVVLRPGDKIQTGRNGRVLLVRGAETILVAPNSVVGLPEDQRPERATTILHQAGSIVLEVEKRNVEHFQVETPYLAAVVKGTRFAVTVSRLGADVRVFGGSVEVSAFKAGQSALVLAGQVAKVASHGNGNLTLGGAGRLGPVQQGTPRKASLDRVPVPARGLGPPGIGSNKGGEQRVDAPGRVRIVAPIGLGQLNIPALTKGLAHSTSSRSISAHKGSLTAPTIWGADGSGTSTTLGGTGLGSGNGNAGGNGNGNAGGNGNGNAYANGIVNGKGKAKGKNP